MKEREILYESYALEAKADYENAAKKVASLYEENKKNYFLNMRLGYLFSYSKKYANSADHYLNASKLVPTSLEPWLALSLFYFNIGDFSKCLEASSEILKREKLNYYGLVRSASCAIKMKAYGTARTYVERGLKLYPLDPIFLEQKGFILVTEGTPNLATEILETLLLISPQNEYAKSILKK